MEEKVKRVERKPLGLMLNNPLNIRKSSSKWQGAVVDGCKGRFVRFESLFYGWRAAVIIMARTYYNRGWRSPKEIIENWAPYTENNTVTYIAFVCKYAELDKNKPMPPIKESPADWFRLLVAMAKIEIGYRWVDDTVKQELWKAIKNHISSF